MRGGGRAGCRRGGRPRQREVGRSDEQCRGPVPGPGGEGELGHRDRRQLYMILKNRDEELNLRLHVRVEDFDYVIFATSAAMKCFGCGKEGHTVRACPDRGEPAPPGVGGASGAADRPGAADHRGAGERSGVTSWPGQSGVREQVELNGSAVDNNAQTGAEEKSNSEDEVEKKQGQKKVICSLLSDTGQELTEPGQIRRRAVEFYSSLYTSEYKEEDELFEGFCSELPQVSEWTNSQLEKPLQMQELQAALQNMQGRKSPGIDGLTVEFFKAFWDILANDILDVFNENYKLLSKALANRLKEAMEQVIHLDQTYCVPGRSSDQEKAFDRVEHNFLWKVMERFGFSAGFTAKIKGYFSRGRGGGGGGQSGVMPVVSSQEELEKLTRRHAVKVLPQAGCSVEEVGSAVGEVVGFESIKSASRMNSAVVNFSG
ncbi:hypothetical protein L3Q82_003277 [Scortum barcoo]|uniref:Uncharacterized protein n=1 Tax=Scortum barcoo TaxID=214431 RepID=A0ACB8VRU6_9TELE|nr:hypothetical protein L3Q82_003277 [Scortum barcoo]